MITYNGHYHSPQADSIKLYFFIFHTEKMKRGPQGISKRWVLLTYLQTEQTTVDYQFILLGTVVWIVFTRSSWAEGPCSSHRPSLLNRPYQSLFSVLPAAVPCAGEVKPTVWTRQDPSGAGNNDTHAQGRQGIGFSLFVCVCVCLGMCTCVLAPPYALVVNTPRPLGVLSYRTSWSPCWTCPTSRWSSTGTSRPTRRRYPTSRDYCRRTWCTSELRSLRCSR